MQKEIYSDEYTKAKNEAKCFKRLMIKSFIGLSTVIMLLAVVYQFVWNHVTVQVIAISLLIAETYIFIRYLKASDKLQKLTPKKDYLLLQTDEKQYKKVKIFFTMTTLCSLLFLVAILVIHVLYDNQWIQFHFVNYILLIFLSLLSSMGNLGALQFVYAMREQYLKVKEKERE